ncbi:MAG: GDSL-type esterase/lipase family protein [Anaerovoracaceae bacterium]
MSRRTKARPKKNNYLVIIIILCVILAIGFGIKIFVIDKNSEDEISKNITKLTEDEALDISTIEKEISESDVHVSKDGKLTKSDYEKIFAGTVIVGDSITEELVTYNYLDNDVVVAKIGISLGSSDDTIKKAMGMNPRNIILSFGMNDMEAHKGKVEPFIKDYKKVTNKIKKELPNTKIYITSVFPIEEKAAQKTPGLDKYNDYNKALVKFCDENNYHFIDNDGLNPKNYFEPDGIHFKYGFYPLLLRNYMEAIK